MQFNTIQYYTLKIGMDDVNHDCWKSNLNIQKWMDLNGIRSMVQLEQYYSSRLLNMVTSTFDRSALVWQDSFDKGIKVLP